MKDIVDEGEARALDESSYYAHLTARNTGLVTARTQSAIRSARVLVAGCGSIGGAAVEPLARIGFTRFHIADTGTYELNNLNRQRATLADLGRNKASVARDSVLSINPHAHVCVSTQGITAANASPLVADADVIVDGVDVTTRSGFEAKIALHEAALHYRKQLVTGWDLAGVLCAQHIDYRSTNQIFDGAITADDLATLTMWEAIARIAPMSAMPTEMLKELADNIQRPEYSVPQLPEAAWQFGSLACSMVVRIVAGESVPASACVDVHALTKPPAQRVADRVQRPIQAARFAHALGIRGALKAAGPRSLLALLSSTD